MPDRWKSALKEIDSVFRSRGKDYFHSGMVVSVHPEEPGLLLAKVRGSSRNIYRQTIRVDELGRLKQDDCSCPVGFGCKHVAAVLYFADRKQIGWDTPAPKIPAETGKLPETGVQDENGQRTVYRLVDDQRSAWLSRQIALNQPAARAAAPEADRWKLIFWLTDGYKGFSDWKLEPAIRFIRKNGLQGRISQYSIDKVTEPLTEAEEELLSLTSSLSGKKALEIALHVAADHPESLEIYPKNSDEPFRFRKVLQLRIRFFPKEVRKEFQSQAMSILFGAKIEADGFVLKEPDTRCATMAVNRRVYFKPEDEKKFIHYIEESFLPPDVLALLFGGEKLMTLSDIRALQEIAERAGSGLSVPFSAHEVELTSPFPSMFVRIKKSSDGYYRVKDMTDVSVFYRYAERTIPEGFAPSADILIPSEMPDDLVILYHRRQEFEKGCISWLRALFQGYIETGYRFTSATFTLKTSLSDFVELFMPRLSTAGVDVEMEGKSLSVSKARFRARIKSGIDWFEADSALVAEDGSEILMDGLEELGENGLLQANGKYFQLSPSDLEKWKKFLELPEPSKGIRKVSRLQFHQLEELGKLADNPDDPLFQSALSLAQKIQAPGKMQRVKPPKGLAAELREYQQAGLDWLYFLHSAGLSGLLADDMGLGKTVQTLAFLQKLKEEKKHGLNVIVVPVSTLGNWEAEIRRFTPELRVFRHHGQSRPGEASALKKADIVLVSYQTLRNDLELFSGLIIHYLILDEAQTIKNSDSRTFQAVKTLRSKFRLSLTGTPVENNTGELWSQMDFLAPGLLGSRKQFQDRYGSPIEKGQDATAAERLRRMVFPFILRRKKSDVAKDLPEKEEIIHYLEMEEGQRRFYDALREKYSEMVKESIERKGLAKSAIQVLEGLLRLRQAALFPGLVDKKYEKLPSCKMEALSAIFDEIASEGQKTLVFSQFVESLKRIESRAKTLGIPYAYLDGQTKKRADVISDFQNNPKTLLFLLSLKAGGVGINLTAAEYVVLFDPWWNPAAETQAVDRSHRIGQTKKVIVYKLIVRGTIEEKILELQESKKALVAQLVTEEQSFYKSLKKEDILALFE